MRNLKRVLSLTLASVMLMGMMVVGSAAKGYDDVSETDNVEAIEVLQEIEVMVGDDRGFGPERPVNRAEMAVVMGKLLNLDYNYYASSCPFTDVYDWAQGWVGACYANKIVSGRGDGIYDPGATVTAVEAASMLMRALGYFRYQNDYADGFELATVTQGTKIGIFEDVGSSASEPMTRNQVAQMVLNALQCGMVQPDGNTINLTTPDGSVLTGKVNYVYVTSSKAYATSISRTQATSMGSANDFTIVELGEQLYNGELKLYGEGSNIADREWDVFGRPARRWEYKGQEIGTYVKKELLKQEYTAKVTGQTLYELLGKSTIDTYHFQIEIDGIQTSGVNPDANASTDLGSAYFTKDDLYRTNKDAVGRTGNGVLTQVYVDTEFAKSNADSSTYWVYISVINTYLAKSNEDYDTKNDDVQLRAWRLENKNTTASPVFVKSAVANKVDVDKSKDFCDIYAKGEDFSIVPDVKKDDLYLITVADGEIQTIEAPEVLSAVTVDAFKLFDHVTTGGQQYNHATTARYDVEAIENWTSSDGTLNLKELTYNVILDDYGYLIGLERNEDANQYVFLTGLEAGASNLYAKQVDGNIIHLDGTMETVKIDLKKSRCGQYDAAGKAHTNHSLLEHNTGAGQHTNLSQLNTWCTYSVDSSGVYTLKMVPVADAKNVTNSTNIKIGQYAQDVDVFNDGTTDSKGNDTKSINTKRVSLKASGAATSDYVYGNDDTVYLTVDLEKVVVDDDYGLHGTSKWIIDEVDTVVTGVKNANLVATDKGADEGGFAYPAAEIYTLYDNKGIVIAAVVIGEDEGASSSYAYIHSSGLEEESYAHSSSTRSGDGEWTWTRKAIVNGEIVTLKEVGADPEYLHPDNMAQGQWYEIKYGANGTVRRADPIKYVNGNTWPAVNIGKWIEKVVDVEASVDEHNTVVLRDTTTVDGLSYKNGTLYTAKDETRGFSVDPDVKTVLALAGKDGDKKGNDWFDTTTDGYNGYIGLEQALREMNVEDYSKFDRESVQVMALFQNGRATTIIINDLNPAPDNKPSGGSKPGGGSGSVSAATGADIAENSISGKISVTRLGDIDLTVSFEAPEWAAGANDQTQVTFDVAISDNAGVVKTLTNGNFGTKDLEGGVYSFSGVTGVTDLKNAIEEGKIDATQLKVQISNVKWTNAAVKYYVTDGTKETPIDKANIKASDGTSDAPTSLAVGGSGVAFSVKYTKPDGYEDDGTVKATYEGMTSNVASGVTVDTTGVTAINLGTAKAEGGKIVKIVIGKVKATTTEEATKYNIEAASGITGLKVAVLDSAPSTIADVAADKWKDLPVTAEKDKVIVVKFAEDGVVFNTSGFAVSNKDDYTAITSTNAIEINKGYRFTMPEANVIITKAENNTPKVLHGWVKSDGSVINLQTDKTAASLLTTMEQKVPLAVEWVNANTEYKAEPVRDLNKKITGMTVDGLTVSNINIGDATTDSVVYVKVDSKDVVADGTSVAKTVAGVLGAAGKTLSDTNIYVSVDTAGTVAAKASNSTDTVADGAVINTNSDKGYFKLTTTTAVIKGTAPNTGDSIDCSSNAPTFGLSIADADKVTAGADTLVKTDATLKVTLKFASDGIVGTKGITAKIEATGATAQGTYKDASAVAEFAKGEGFTATTTAELEFTVDTFTGPVSKVEVTLGEA